MTEPDARRVVRPRVLAVRKYQKMVAELLAEWPDKRLPRGAIKALAKKHKHDYHAVAAAMKRAGFGMDRSLGSYSLWRILDVMDEVWEREGRRATHVEISKATKLSVKMISQALYKARNQGVLPYDNPRYADVEKIEAHARGRIQGQGSVKEE